MPIGYLGSFAADNAYIDRLDSIRRAARLPVDINVASNVTALARTYPGISPGLVASLAQAGVGPGKQANELWQAELRTTTQTGAIQKPKKTKRAVRAAKELAHVNEVAHQWRAAGVPEKDIERVTMLVSQGAIDPANLSADFHVVGERGATGEVLSGRQAARAYAKLGKEYLDAKGPSFLKSALGEGLATSAYQLGLSGKDPNTIVNEIPGVGEAHRGAKTALRYGFAGLQAGYEDLHAAARAGMSEIQRQGIPILGIEGDQGQRGLPAPSAFVEQTTLGQNITTGASMGEGILPSWNSPAMKQQAEAARKYSPYLVGGHAWTPGRAFAQGVGMDANTDSFRFFSGLVDASIAMSKLDPAAFGLGEMAALRQAGRRILDPAEELARNAGLADRGLFNNLTKFWTPKARDEWAATKEGERFFDAIRRETNTRDMYYALRNHIPEDMLITANDGTPILSRLADETTSNAAVYEILKPYLGREIRNFPKFKYGARPNRLLEPIPADFVDLSADNLNQGGASGVVITGERALANADVSAEIRDRLFDQGARIGNNRAAARRYYDAVNGAIAERLGIPRDQFDRIFKLDNHLNDEINMYALDKWGEPIPGNEFVNIDGKPVGTPHPIHDGQIVNSQQPLPDFRAVRLEVGELGGFLKSAPADFAVAALDEAMSYWRRAMLMRPAWGVRVVLEEQLRIAAAGGDSMFHHPLSWMSWVIGNPEENLINRFQDWEDWVKSPAFAQARAEAGRLKTAYAKTRAAVAPTFGEAATGFKARFGKGFVGRDGQPFTNFAQYNDARATRFGAIADQRQRILLHQFARTDTYGEFGAESLTRELASLNDSQMGRALVDAENIDDVKQSFWNGDLRPTRDYMAEDLEGLGGDSELAHIASDHQIDLLSEAVRGATADNPTLIDIIRTGQIDGTYLRHFNGGINDAAVAKMQTLIDSGEAVPLKVRRQLSEVIPFSEKGARRAKLDHVLDTAFEWMMPRWTDLFSRSPYARQQAWEAWERLLPHMNAKARQETLANARVANLGKATITRMERKVERLDAIGDDLLKPTLSSKTATRIAMRYSLNQTKNLLYDLSEKSQFMDMARNFIPFGEAWREVLTRWIDLTKTHPQIVRRGQQILMGARSPGSEVMGSLGGGTELVDILGNPTGEGFFHRNQFGEEVFTYPGSQWLNDTLWGVPIPLTGSVQGLNLIGNGLPGLGPAVQIPLGWIIPDKPAFDGLNKLLFPYGKSGSSPFDDPVGQVLGAATPTWLRRVQVGMNSPQSTRTFATATMHVADYLASTGDYDLQGPNAQAEVNRLLSDAKHKARMLYFTMGLGAWGGLPSAPNPEWVAHDKSGNLTTQWRITDWFYKQSDKHGYDAAISKFLDRFGTDNYLLLQPSSQATVAGLNAPTSTAGSRWVRDHPEIRADYPNTYGLFAPDSKDFDYGEYKRQFDRGERRTITPERAVQLANHRLASYQYHRVLEALQPDGISDRERMVLRQLKTDLLSEFPGYDPEKGSSEAPSTTTLISELQRAADDPRLARTAPGRLLNQYFAYRSVLIAAQRRADPSASHTEISGSAKMAPLRQWVLQWGEAQASRHPRFSPLWDVLSREMDI